MSAAHDLRRPSATPVDRSLHHRLRLVRPGPDELNHTPAKVVMAAFVAVFAVFLILPTVQLYYSLIHCKEVNENRNKAERPQASCVDIFLNRNNAAIAYEKYYNDSYGLRDLFIRVKNQIDYSVFAKSDKVHIGQDGWLFYRTVLDAEQVGLERLTAQREQQIFQSVDRLAEHLAQRGITLIMMPCPQKNTIYPELVPYSAPRRPKITFYQRYCEFLQHNPHVVYIDVNRRLLELKRDHEVFYRTDFHWTDVAAYFFARDLVETIGRWEGIPQKYHPLETRLEDFSGGQATFIPMLWTPSEITAVPVQNWKEDGSMQNGPKPYLWVYRSQRREALPPLVIFGDSFSDSLHRTGFQIYFREVHRLHNDLPWPQRLAAIPPGTKYLLMEHIEDNTQMMGNLPPL